MVKKVNVFTLSKGKSSFKLLEKKQFLSPPGKKIDLSLIKKASNLESIPPYGLYEEQQQHFQNGLIL